MRIYVERIFWIVPNMTAYVVKYESAAERGLWSMEAAMEMSAARMADLEQRILALENRTRRVLWSGMDSQQNREDGLVLRYGEYVDKTAAAQILGVTRATVYAMLSDGRIEAACAGRRVDVRSIARYMNCSGCGVKRRGRKPKGAQVQ